MGTNSKFYITNNQIALNHITIIDIIGVAKNTTCTRIANSEFPLSEAFLLDPINRMQRMKNSLNDRAKLRI